MAARIPDRYEGPGLVDLQLNGYAGHDFNAESLTPEMFFEVRDALLKRGVVAALPTLITDDVEYMLARAEMYADVLDEHPEMEETFPGLHIEGPFISEEDGPRGAHPKRYCMLPRNLPDLYEQLQDAGGGRIRLLTLAPELPGALELIGKAIRGGTRIAIGHTSATPAQIEMAVGSGAILSTHLGNGCHQMLPRTDNYLQAQLSEDRLFASFIADGHHMPFYVLKNFTRAKTPSRCILITDAIAAADVGPGEYTLAGEPVVVTADLRAHKPGQQNLSGSALTLDRAVINVAKYCGVSFEAVWAMASTIPAALIGYTIPATVSVAINGDGFRVGF